MSLPALDTLARTGALLVWQVLAAVYGPREVSNRSQADTNKAIVRCEYSMAAFSTGERRRRGKSDRRSTEISMAIGNTMEQNILTELLPRTQIDIYVQVLQADGGTRCAAINAAFLALADAGVPMHDCLAACAAGYLEDTALLDLNYTEDAGGGPDVAVALQTGVDQVLLLQADNKWVEMRARRGVWEEIMAEQWAGKCDHCISQYSLQTCPYQLLTHCTTPCARCRLSIEVFEEVVELATNGCRAIGQFIRDTLVAHVGRLALTTEVQAKAAPAE